MKIFPSKKENDFLFFQAFGLASFFGIASPGIYQERSKVFIPSI